MSEKGGDQAEQAQLDNLLETSKPEDTDDEQYSSENLDLVAEGKTDSSFQSEEEKGSDNDNSEELLSNASNEDDALADFEYDDDGRPKGMVKLFDLIKGDLGEQESENFKLFYDLMSNQIKYCLASYINGTEEASADKQQKGIIDPMLLVNMIMQQKQLLLKVTSSQEEAPENEGALPDCGSLSIEPFSVKLRLKPKTKKTKALLQEKNKNPLIQINTQSTKSLDAIIEYLATK